MATYTAASTPPPKPLNSMVRMSNYGHEEDEREAGGRRMIDGGAANPHYMTGLNHGKASNFYINGNSNFAAKKIVFNPKHYRDFTHYMDHLTDKIKPSFGVVRKVCTPQNGHRVSDLNQLQQGSSYVVAGTEKFRPYTYDQITSTERRKSPPRNYDADPVVHSKLYKNSARIHKYNTHSKIIRVSANGKGMGGPRIVLLSYNQPWTLESILRQVDELLSGPCGGTVASIHFISGIKITEADQISSHGHYVAVPKGDRFRSGIYPEKSVKNIHTSPRLERKSQLDPLFARSNNSTSQSSPEHSNASTQNGSVNNHHARRRPPRREEDQVFPAKPIKHTRSSEKTRPVDLDRDEGGKFKAKQRNSNTQGAREVQDSRYTKVDVPIDQQEARTVDEESGKPADRNKDDRYRQQPRNDPPPPRGGVQYKPNSKRPPQQTVTPRNNKNHNNVNAAKVREEEIKRQLAASKIQASYRGYRVRKQYRPTQRPRRASLPQEEKRSRNSRPTPKSVKQKQSHADTFDESEKAATRIQAGFRGYRTRKVVKARKTIHKEASDAESRLREETKAATKIQAGFKGYKVRKENQAKNAADDAQSLYVKNREKAASKIQAGFKGYSTRKNLKSQKNTTAQEPSQRDEPEKAGEDYGNAAAKIQAGFKGYKVRKGLKKKAVEKADSVDEDYDEVEAAATKIQAGFRGYRVRKGLKADVNQW